MQKTIKKTVNPEDKPTVKQIAEIEKASTMTPVFDNDSPDFSYEELAQMAKVAKTRKNEQKKEVVTLRISAAALKKAKATGKGYTGFLGRLLENALNDKDLVIRSL